MPADHYRIFRVNSFRSISDFYVAGINYRKSDSAIRGEYAIGNEQYDALLKTAAQNHYNEVFVLSTCNRTEIYGIAPSAKDLSTLLCAHTSGDLATFKELAYVKRGREAIEHLFNVAAGIDSQILGDYEIVGQIKLAVKFSSERGCTGIFIERLLNSVLQSSRKIRSTTQLSSGTVSVSFAAVQYIGEQIADMSDKKIVLIGTGKIGRNTCKNAVEHLGTHNITLINRTMERARELAAELGLKYAPIEAIDEQIKAADVILVATNASTPTVLRSQLENSGSKIVIDLSIPYNVDPTAAGLPGIHLVNVDDLAKVNDATLRKREAEVPKAKSIIAEYIADFKEWYLMRRNVPVIKAVKDKLEHLQSCSYGTEMTEQDNKRIQQVLNAMANRMKSRNEGGCNYISAINDFMSRS